MKTQKKREEKIKYQRLVKLVEKAQKEAEKFVQKNIRVDQELQIKYS